ncbi:MAG: histidinol-phosphate aminotransferase family protein [Oscillospiraceae bacterium]|jgi:histidinol-phosphate aminotransferase|nr:histidinol-phosphate aminotransferase family protein [Oscillospiraceae bacterium]
MMNLPEKLKDFKPYPPMTETIPVRLDGNESCYPLPDKLMNEIAEVVRNTPLHRYPDPAAAEVCALAEAFWDAPEGSAVAGNGSDELISVALSALLPRGGKLLVCDPDFSMYRFYAALYEIECVGVPRTPGVPGAEELIQAGRGADAVILSNPCNPTGQVLPLPQVVQMVETLTCPVLLDEAYMDFWEESSVLPYIERYNNLIVLKTCSKNLALAGIRLGFVFAGAELADILRSVKSPYNVSSVTQAIGAAVLRHPELLLKNTNRIRAQKDKLYARLSEWARFRDGVTVTDTAANFVLLDLPDAAGCHAALRAKGIAVRLINGGLRITAGTGNEITALMEALQFV